MKRLRPVSALTAEQARGIRFFCTDIDDTLTREGKLHAAAFDSLWKLYDEGIYVIPVTGRPAGWCDMIAREWPVAAVVGENGAFSFYLENGRLCEYHHPSIAPAEVRRKLEEVKEAVLAEVPGTRVAKDQRYRLYDLAIDYREEPPYLDLSSAEEIVRICDRFGAQAKISSIHVNVWFGDYNKLDMLRILAELRWGSTGADLQRQVLFCGDSPNDEPMFGYFPLGVAVRNIAPMLHLMASKPAFVTGGGHEDGVSELAGMILSRRKS